MQAMATICNICCQNRCTSWFALLGVLFYPLYSLVNVFSSVWLSRSAPTKKNRSCSDAIMFSQIINKSALTLLVFAVGVDSFLNSWWTFSAFQWNFILFAMFSCLFSLSCPNTLLQLRVFHQGFWLQLIWILNLLQ